MSESNAGQQSPSESRGREWIPAVSLILFFISTTIFDVQIIVSRGPKLLIAFVLGLICMQGYVLWYYFWRLRSATKIVRIPKSHFQLFTMAMIGTTVVAFVGVYAVSLLLR